MTTTQINTTDIATDDSRRTELYRIVNELIAELNASAPHIYEGVVMSLGHMPYRRLDCDRRALAYIRARPRKDMVRIDVSGLWRMPRESPLLERGSGASATLVIRTREDKAEAIAFLLATVEATRVYQVQARKRHEERERQKKELRSRLRSAQRKQRRLAANDATSAAQPVAIAANGGEG